MSTHPQAPAPGSRKPVTLPRLREMRTNTEPIAMLTCYDASFARLLDAAGVDYDRSADIDPNSFMPGWLQRR